QSTNLQTKSGMMHTVHSTSVGMHGSSCGCPECQRQGAQQLRQQNQNFLFDASNNNTPNSGAIQQPILSEKQMRRDFCEAVVNSNRPMKNGDHQLQTNSGVMQQIRSVSVGVHEPLPERIDCSRPNEQQTYAQPMRDHELLRNLTSQLNRQFSENMNKRVPQEVVDCSGCGDNTEEHYSKKSAHLTDYSNSNRPLNSGVHVVQGVKTVQQQVQSVEKANDSVHQSLIEQCDKQNAHYSGNSLYQLTDYSLKNRPNSKCRESVGKFGSACETPVLKVGSQTAKELLANSDNNNRPNTNCYERLQQFDSSETTAVHKSV
ncbi:MAG: hypothetical protein GY820_03655, partial [Gammaproteobacteria bacterium]|nr:hypothetical protein [Gammaproteobacteria bacterium]